MTIIHLTKKKHNYFRKVKHAACQNHLFPLWRNIQSSIRDNVIGLKTTNFSTTYQFKVCLTEHLSCLCVYSRWHGDTKTLSGPASCDTLSIPLFLCLKNPPKTFLWQSHALTLTLFALLHNPIPYLCLPCSRGPWKISSIL